MPGERSVQGASGPGAEGPPRPCRLPLAALLVLVVVVLGGCSATGAPAPRPTPSVSTSGPAADPRPLPSYTRVAGVVVNDDVASSDDPIGRWSAETGVEDVRITSTADGSSQPALWAAPPGPGAPLLVVVHSWSTGYEQELNIPLAQWAEQVGWGYVQPDFRGVNDDPAATGSALAVQDVLDAVDFAITTGGVDPDRVYVLGFSGGGMMSLLLAGTHPDRFAGAVSWVPIHDLGTWYAYNRAEQPQRAYAGQIAASCGGDPTTDRDAAASCAARSPATVLPAAAAAGVPVYLGAGVDDDIVPPSDAALTFNALAAPGDRLGPEAVDALRQGQLPADLGGRIETETWFSPDDPDVLFARTSAAVTLVVFRGGHAMVYYPGLEWLARLDAAA